MFIAFINKHFIAITDSTQVVNYVYILICVDRVAKMHRSVLCPIETGPIPVLLFKLKIATSSYSLYLCEQIVFAACLGLRSLKLKVKVSVQRLGDILQG